MFFNDISIFSVLAAAVLSMALGFVWYSPWAFGPAWSRSLGREAGPSSDRGEGRPAGLSYLASFALALLTAYVFAAVFNSLVVTSLGGMAFVGFLMWLGFVAPMKAGDYLFAGHSVVYVAITAGYQLVSLVAMALVTGLFA